MAKLLFINTLKDIEHLVDKTWKELEGKEGYVHLTVPELLEKSRAGATDEEIAADIGELLTTVDKDTKIVCTCSSLGVGAELLAKEEGLDIVRIDREMVKTVLTHHDEFGVLYTTASTVEPTSKLIAEEAEQLQKKPVIHWIDGTAAWEHLGKDNRAYLSVAADAVTSFEPQQKVVMLAQGSLTGVEEFLGNEYVLYNSMKEGLAGILKVK